MKKITLITLLLIITFALNAYVIVRQDGTGHFTNLQDAINSISGTETILLVGSGTPYTGSNNRNLSWNGNIKHIYIRGISNPVIDCQNLGYAFKISIGNIDDKIEGVTIKNTQSQILGGAIIISGSNMEIKNNTFINCSSGGYSADYVSSRDYNGGAIYVWNGGNIEITGNTFNHCVAYSGGAIAVSNGYFLIENNTFYDNHACSAIAYGDNAHNGEGGAIYTDNADVDILNNSFTSNASPDGGAAISSTENGNVSVIDNTFDSNYATAWIEYNSGTCLMRNIDVLTNNIIRNHNDSSNDFGHLLENVNNIHKRNNTYINNSIRLGQGETNSIFIDSPNYFSDTNYDLINCLINNCGIIDSDNFLWNCITNVDPQLDANYIPRWDATAKSPCIDAGEPGYHDADGTVSDIGAKTALAHRQDSWKIWDATSSPSMWKWQSFPALDDVCTVNDPDMALNMIGELLDNQIIYRVYYNNGFSKIHYFDQAWQNTSHIFTSPMGYKFMTWPQTYDVTIDVAGFKEADTKSISLQQGDNWIGYFLDYPQTWQEAFDGYLDDINSISTQYWFALKIDGKWLVSSTVTDLVYGEMVVVDADVAFTLNWATGGTGDDTKLKTAESFTWDEEADYVPIFVELNERDMPEEIGVILNGECQGATVVEGNLVQICAYITEEPGDEISLEFHYPDRSENRIISAYHTYNEISQKFVNKTSVSGEAEYYYFSVRGEDEVNPLPEKVSIRNYPNPFNPTTTINYSLPVSGVVNIDIYNVKGQKVKQLISGNKDAGTHTQTWNGVDDKGNPVGSGIYFYQLKTADTTLKGKMMLLK